MRILLDECIDERLRLSFAEHDCQSARFAKLAGLKNGQLLAAAENAEFAVLVTVDQNISSQQNLRDRKVAIIVLCAPTNRPRDLLPLVPVVKAALCSINPDAVLRVRL